MNRNTTRELFDVSVWKQGKHEATLCFHVLEASISLFLRLMMQLERSAGLGEALAAALVVKN